MLFTKFIALICNLILLYTSKKSILENRYRSKFFLKNIFILILYFFSI